MNAPSTASKTAIVASFELVRRSHRITTLSRPADSKVQPSGAIDMHVTAVKCACRNNMFDCNLSTDNHTLITCNKHVQGKRSELIEQRMPRWLLAKETV